MKRTKSISTSMMASVIVFTCIFHPLVAQATEPTPEINEEAISGIALNPDQGPDQGTDTPEETPQVHHATPNHQRLLSDVRHILRNYPANATQSSFCYSVGNDTTVHGINSDEPVRTASVMKTMTTMWAVEKLGPNYRFQTKIYYSPSLHRMHIVGGRDPYFDRDRMYLLMSDLKRRGITSVDVLTADTNFYFNFDLTEFVHVSHAHRGWVPYMESEAHRNWLHTRSSELTDLRYVFNPAGWRRARAARYEAARRLAPASLHMIPPSQLEFHAGSIDIQNANPLLNAHDVQILRVVSRPLINYVKVQNMYSVNPMADELFLALGGAPEFRSFMHSHFGISMDELNRVYSGSGLPIFAHGTRNDTSLTCSTFINLLRRFDQDLDARFNLDLADVMMVSGVDHGTYGNANRSLILKTGTLGGGPSTAAHNLGGRADTGAGEVYFGFFVQSSRASVAAFAPMLASMNRSMGGARRIQHRAYTFHNLAPDSQMSLAEWTAAPIAAPSAPSPIIGEHSVNHSYARTPVPRVTVASAPPAPVAAVEPPHPVVRFTRVVPPTHAPLPRTPAPAPVVAAHPIPPNVHLVAPVPHLPVSTSTRARTSSPTPTRLVPIAPRAAAPAQIAEMAAAMRALETQRANARLRTLNGMSSVAAPARTSAPAAQASPPPRNSQRWIIDAMDAE